MTVLLAITISVFASAVFSDNALLMHEVSALEKKCAASNGVPEYRTTGSSIIDVVCKKDSNMYGKF